MAFPEQSRRGLRKILLKLTGAALCQGWRESFSAERTDRPGTGEGNIKP